MIVVTFALPVESSGLVALLQEKTQAGSGDTRMIRGNLGKRPIGIFHTGIGRKISGRLDNFLLVAQPKVLISSGFAGSINDRFGVGDLFLAQNFSDGQLLAFAEEILQKKMVRRGKLLTSPEMIGSAAQRDEIARAHGADAVDMETETIAQACAGRGIRVLSLRVISDTARKPFPAPPDVLFDIERQRTNAGKLSLYLVTHPAGIWRLIRFARQIARARENLTNALVALLQSNQL